MRTEINNHFLERKFEDSLRIHFNEIGDIVSIFATGKVKTEQERRERLMELTIRSIEFVSMLKLHGAEHFETASLLDYFIQLIDEEVGTENLQELDLIRVYGRLIGLEEQLFSGLASELAYA